MKLEIKSKWNVYLVAQLLFLGPSTFANTGLTSLFKYFNSHSSGLAPEVSTQHKALTHRLIGQGLVRTVKIHNDLPGLLSLSDSIDAKTADQIGGLIDVRANGYLLKKYDSNSTGYTLIPVRHDQPLQIELSLNRGNATSLLDILKSKAKTQGVEFPSWTDSRFMNLLNLVSFRFTFERPLDKETEDYFLSVILCEQEQLEKLMSEPSPDSFYALATKYGHPGWFDICINLPKIKPIES